MCPVFVSVEQEELTADSRHVEVHFQSHELHMVAPDHLKYDQPSIVSGRNDVVTVTPWLAPVVWEGIFNPVLLDSIYKPQVLPVPSSKRWQEISARRTELIQKLIEEKLRNNSDYIFCLDVDSKFHGRWGTESLGGLIAVIHPGYYRDNRKKFPYERRPDSRAYIATGEGDFYYCGGGIWRPPARSPPARQNLPR
ncbi:Globoside alpha-1,3-N-acetylgalactosaminyltransferase 1 [Larimichthys crocea]|uniref:Globoside alpha-1,3-N-acetylgalactosaminyltransferase 1 n=1 Tax=Larimichthys crocea TaxID=215358 RepID=A0A6G0J5U0_LARCR|nr:Globoside alpha-1,3-N-acetylgalactosaminyltransferase 1 [Larimichthys crocea]